MLPNKKTREQIAGLRKKWSPHIQPTPLGFQPIKLFFLNYGFLTHGQRLVQHLWYDLVHVIMNEADSLHCLLKKGRNVLHLAQSMFKTLGWGIYFFTYLIWIGRLVSDHNGFCGETSNQDSVQGLTRAQLPMVEAMEGGPVCYRLFQKSHDHVKSPMQWAVVDTHIFWYSTSWLTSKNSMIGQTKRAVLKLDLVGYTPKA